MASSEDKTSKSTTDKPVLARGIESQASKAATKAGQKLVRLSAAHQKITIPSNDQQQYDVFGPSPVPDTATMGVSIQDLEYIYLTNAVVHKAINIRANRIIGNGFDLMPSDEEGISEELATEAVNDCQKFLAKIKYRTSFRQSIINALAAGNEWTEMNFNAFKHMVNISHADFQTVDFRRNFLNNKVLLGADGKPVGFWQYIPDLSQLYYSIAMMYGEIETYENMKAAQRRLKESQSLELKDPDGNPIAVMTTKPNFMFLKNEEIVHLAFNTVNDNPLGVSMIIPAYNALNHLNQVMYAVAEAINDMGYPKPDVEVGDPEHGCDQALLDAAEDMVTDPVRREAYAHSYLVKIKYLQSQGMGNGGISEYPEWFFTEAAIGLRTPKEILLSEGTSKAGGSQASNDFDRDIEVDRATFEEYVYEIMSRFLKSRGYLSTEYERCPYTPKIKWEAMITEDEALREKMALEKWEKDAITFNELRVLLGMDEVEDMERGDAYKSELTQPKADSVFNTDGNLPKSEQMPFDSTGKVQVKNPLENKTDEETGATVTTPKAPQEKQFIAQHELLPASANPSKHVSANESLNRQQGTTDVDYKQIARKSVGTRITSVGKAKARAIRDTIVNKEAAKKSAKSIIKEIKKIGDYTDAHAKMVMVTEHKNMEEGGSLQNAMQKGMKFKKWNAHMDKDTSPLCKALNGQVIPIDGEFWQAYKDENGKSHQWRGKAPAAHPNCRSFLTYQNERS